MASAPFFILYCICGDISSWVANLELQPAATYSRRSNNVDLLGGCSAIYTYICLHQLPLSSGTTILLRILCRQVVAFAFSPLCRRDRVEIYKCLYLNIVHFLRSMQCCAVCQGVSAYRFQVLVYYYYVVLGYSRDTTFRWCMPTFWLAPARMYVVQYV